jgi:LemA protein
MLDIILIILVGMLILLVFEATYYYWSTYNTFIGLKNDILKAWANIDVLLKQRNDEIPNLVSTVSGYMEHEQKALIEVAKARTTLQLAESIGEKSASDKLIHDTLQRLYAVVESYPQLKADQTFLKLQKRISGLENQIADRREFYNDAATIYNTRRQSFPDKVVADSFGFGRMPLFRASEKERMIVEVRFREGSGEKKE